MTLIRKWRRHAFVIGVLFYLLAAGWFFFAPVTEERITETQYCFLLSKWRFEEDGRFHYFSYDLANEFCGVGDNADGTWTLDGNVIEVYLGPGQVGKAAEEWQLRGFAGGRLLVMLHPDGRGALLAPCK
jgi:hypothetical protein